MPDLGVKKCTKCGESKKPTEFYKSYKSNGLRGECKLCTHLEKKKRYHKVKPYRELGVTKTRLRDRFLGY